MADKVSKQQPTPSKTNSKGYKKQPAVSSPKSIYLDSLTPDNILYLQRTLGNQYVLDLVRRKENSEAKSSKSHNTSIIQRAGGTRSIHDQEHTLDDPGIVDTIGLTGDWMGTNPTEGLAIGGDNGTGDAMTGMDLGTTGSVISTVTGTMGMGLGTYNLVQNIRMHKQANKALKQYKQSYKGVGNIPGDTELYATIELLKRKKTDAIKGEWESAGNILGGISGFINGVAGFFTSATAGVVAGVAFGVGAGLGAILGTISAIRDFVSAGKRSKTKKEIGKVRAGYIELYNGLSTEVSQLNDENVVRQSTVDNKNLAAQDKQQASIDKQSAIIDAQQEFQDLKDRYENANGLRERQELMAEIMLAKPKLNKKVTQLEQEKAILDQEKLDIEEEARVIGQEIVDTAQTIHEKEDRYDQYGNMITALKTAERKEGYGGKIATGLLNLVSAGGGIALLAATLGAGAAAGPVGWVLSGIALIGILGFAIGMHVKRKVRKSNVKRMRQELVMVGNYVANGTVTGSLPDGYTVGANANARQDDIWHREMFATTEKKGWFNKLFSKKRSGKMTMRERTDMMKAYLGKYDKDAQGEIIATGFMNALRAGSEGDQMVSNPAYSDDLSPQDKLNTPTEVTLRNLNMGLLIHFFGDKAEEMKTSLLADDSTDEGAKKVADAKDLLVKKLKLG